MLINLKKECWEILNSKKNAELKEILENVKEEN